MEEPVHLGFFGYESSGWQATICGDRVNVGEKGVGRSGKLLQASNLQQQRAQKTTHYYFSFSSHQDKVILIDKNFF